MNIEIAKRLMGIEYRISKDELKSIYRKRAIELHPDTNKHSNAAEDFRNLNAAYQFLVNNLHNLRVRPPPKPTCPTIFRVLDGKNVERVEIPRCDLKEDDLCLYFMWKGKEYRTILKRGTELPTSIVIHGIDLRLDLIESWY